MLAERSVPAKKKGNSNNGTVCKHSTCDLHLHACISSLNPPIPYGSLIIKELTVAVLVRFIMKVSAVCFTSKIYNRILKLC